MYNTIVKAVREVVNEDVNKSIGELRVEMNAGFQSIRSEMNLRFEQVDERFKQVDERFKQIDERFDRFEQKVDKRFDRLEERLDRFEQKWEQRVERLEIKIDKTGKALTDGFDEARQSIANLEGIVEGEHRMLNMARTFRSIVQGKEEALNDTAVAL
jgi:hypothetical protein